MQDVTITLPDGSTIIEAPADGQTTGQYAHALCEAHGYPDGRLQFVQHSEDVPAGPNVTVDLDGSEALVDGAHYNFVVDEEEVVAESTAPAAGEDAAWAGSTDAGAPPAQDVGDAAQVTEPS